MTSLLKFSTGLAIAFIIATASGPVSAKGLFDCHLKGKHGMVGQCKNLGHGRCSFTADMTTVKLRCREIRRG